MIKLYLGGIGSGKSISIVKEIVESEQPFYTNFRIYNAKNSKRLKINDIITKKEKDDKKSKGKDVVNWKFWRGEIQKFRNFNIAVDELHNLMHSRRSMSKFNILMSMWIAQIRKVCGSSEKTHFYAISQELERIDISVRDLANLIVWCRKVETKQKITTTVRENGRLFKKEMPMVWIVRYYFLGSDCTRRYSLFRWNGEKSYNFRTKFLANEYFSHYDSYELIDFGESEYL